MSERRFICCVDIGYSNLKQAFGFEDSKPTMLISPVGAAPESRLPQDFQIARDGGVEVLVNGEPFVACVQPGRLSNWTRTLNEGYQDSDTYRALLHAALLQTGREQIDVVVTGLPVDLYKDRDLRERLRASLEGTHEVAKGVRVHVAEARVIAQPIGAYFDFIDQFEDLELLEEARVLTLDPGYFSFDWVTIDQGDVRAESSDTNHLASSKVLEKAVELMRENYGRRAVTAEQLEVAIRHGRDEVLAKGTRVEFRPYLEKASKEIGPVVLNDVKNSMRAADRDVDFIFLAGGGAVFYRDATAAAFPDTRIIVPKEPVFANVRGYWFFGRQ